MQACKRIRRQAGLDILARPLQNGDVALCLFNKGTSRRTVTYDINALADDTYLTSAKRRASTRCMSCGATSGSTTTPLTPLYPTTA